ncbi:hypothetical protein [Variovorax sp. 54]|uniref:hypothetical protein n=1 Tax=Variovorax sp. 54 TaxID=2035212 RepID=UPI00211F402F|nr:hypothetical protein [Variovorax sp. 54]
MDTVFTFVAAAVLDAAAAVLVAGLAPAFSGFSAAGLVATLLTTLLASEGAGFFELGIRPRYDKKRQAGSQARCHADSTTMPVHRHGQNNWETRN